MTEVKNTILEVWHDEATNTFLDTICKQQERMITLPNRQTIRNYMDSLDISYQDIRSHRNIPTPSFCIYANGSMIKDSGTWTNIRKYLANREYRLKFQEPGIIETPLRKCSICHRTDHPLGLCPFLEIQNWNGPTKAYDLPLLDLEGRGYDPVNFRDRFRLRNSHYP